MTYEKPSHVLKDLYSLLSKESCWQTYFKEAEIMNKDNFVRRYCTGLFEYVHSLGKTEYTTEDTYEYILSQVNEYNKRRLTPNIEDFKRILDFPEVFTQVCEGYYNNQNNLPVIALLQHLNERFSLLSFYSKYIPQMYKYFTNPRTTRFIYPLYVSRAILDDIIFESFVDDFKGQNLQQKALPILFRESLGIQHSHSLADGYKEYIIQMYKKKPIIRYVEKLVHAIYHNCGLSDRDKKLLIKKIDSMDEWRYKVFKEELPDKTYRDTLYAKGPKSEYIKIVYIPTGGMNKRFK